jgi:hypothetical protein
MATDSCFFWGWSQAIFSDIDFCFCGYSKLAAPFFEARTMMGIAAIFDESPALTIIKEMADFMKQDMFSASKRLEQAS